DAVAFALADQRAGQGRGYREAAVADIGLVLADNAEGLLLVGLLIGQRHRRAELDCRARQFRDIDDLGAGDLVLEFGEAAFEKALALATRAVLGVLRNVAVGAGLGDGADDGRTIDRFQPLRLVLQPSIPLDGHRDLIYW